MSNLRAAAQQALEALEQSETTVPYEGFGMAQREAERKHQAAITALRDALAEPVQEPVAWRVQRNDGEYELYFVKASAERAAECYIKRPPVEPLFAAPPKRTPMTEDIFARAIERTHGIKE